MSMSFHTKAKIPRSFFPAIGKTAMLSGKPVVARNYSDEKDKNATSFVLVDQQGYEMGLYFHEDGFLNFFDFTAGNWELDGDDGLWMRKAVLALRRRRVQVLPPGPGRMPRPKQPKLPRAEAAFHGIRDLGDFGNEDGVLYLPTTALTVTPEAFKEALERHGLVVTQVEKRRAFKVQGPPFISLDWNIHGGNFYDRYDWTEVENEGPPTRLGELRILPYDMEFTMGFVALWFDRPVRPADDLKRIRIQAWPLMESMSAEDESPVVKEARTEKAENERIAAIDMTCTQQAAEITALQARLRVYEPNAEDLKPSPQPLT